MGSGHVLVVGTGARRYALPLAHVVETMRPLPIEPVADAPDFVLGVAVVRGVPIAVVDLAALHGGRAGAVGRFVTVDAGGRRVALAVDQVLGIHQLDQATLAELPALLAGASDTIAALSTLDGALLAVLGAAQLIPPGALAALDGAVPA